VLRSVAVTEGFSDAELARLVRREQLVVLQRGAYLEEEPASAEVRQRAVVRATVAGLRTPGRGQPCVGGAAARPAAPPAAEPQGAPHPRATGCRQRQCPRAPARRPVARRRGRLGTGLLLTDVTRTVVDLARSAPFESAVVVADAALASRRTTPEALAACLSRMGPVPGSRAVARVLAFADGRSESVGESRSRVLFSRAGLPAPQQLQLAVRRRDGGLIGRCDFGWEDAATLGEFDGRIKYGRLLRAGQTAGNAVYQEKLREDEWRDTGRQVVRWCWPELDTPRVVADRLRRAFARGRTRP
jgi:hypothetical protein